MTRAKQNSEKKNLGSYFLLKYASLDNITHELRKFGPGGLIYKVDIGRAFRHIHIDLGDIDLLGIRH